jgi:hypothetical protein
MSRRDAHLDAMLRQLGAAYYQTLHGQGRQPRWRGQRTWLLPPMGGRRRRRITGRSLSASVSARETPGLRVAGGRCAMS